MVLGGFRSFHVLVTTPFCHLNQFTRQQVSLHTYANNLKIALENLPHVSYPLNVG